MINIYAKTCANCMQILYTKIVNDITLGPAYNEFGYNEHPVKVHSHKRQRLHVRVHLCQIATLHLWDASNAKNGYRTHSLRLTQHPHRHNVSNLTQTHTQTLTLV